MKTETLIDAIGKIDASYVEEAELWQTTSRLTRSREKASWLTLTWKRTLATAACFVLLAAGLVAALRNLNNENLTGGADTGAPHPDDAGGVAEEGAAGGIPVEQGGGAAEIPPQDNTSGQKDDADQQETALVEGIQNGNVKDRLFAILENVESVTVTHYSEGREEVCTLEGADLEALKKWAENLNLGTEATFEKGAYPGENEEGGELYFFESGEGAELFSYRNFGECYLEANGNWYLVLNPSEPPVEE